MTRRATIGTLPAPGQDAGPARLSRRLVVTGAIGGLCPSAFAQGETTYPDRPVRVVVPFAPGGANDILGRLFCAVLAERFRQPFVVENRSGAQGIVGTDVVAKARPDGHTLLVGASGPLVFNPITFPSLPHDPARDLAPIAVLGSYPLLLLVGADAPMRSLGDLIAWAKAHPGRGTYGAVNAAFQLATELFKQRSGTDFECVGYRGNADVTTALAAGELTMALVDSGPAAGPLAAGRVRALAVLTPGRLAAHPAVPTMAEAGFPGFEASFWCGLAAPAGTPPAILSRLADAVAAASRDPTIRERMAALSIEPDGATPETFGRRIVEETALWRDVAARAGLRFDR